MNKLILLLAAASITSATAQESSLLNNTPTGPTDGPLTPDAVKLTPDVPAAPAPGAAPLSNQPSATSEQLTEALRNLTPDQRKEYAQLLQEASALVQGIRIQEAMERIMAAESIYADFYALQNLKGAAYTKVRDFDKASACFERCLELNPQSVEARFNLAEMSFVKQEYEEGLAAFQKLLDENPKLPMQTRNLLLYKIYLCNLLIGQNEEAEKMLGKFSYLSDTPEYYYANAAKSFKNEDPNEARSWLRSAQRIYSKTLQDLFVDSLVEAGWIETL